MASIPVIVACGVGLGCLLTSVFLFEAFLMHLYDGVGKGIIVSEHNSAMEPSQQCGRSVTSGILTPRSPGLYPHGTLHRSHSQYHRRLSRAQSIAHQLGKSSDQEKL